MVRSGARLPMAVLTLGITVAASPLAAQEADLRGTLTEDLPSEELVFEIDPPRAPAAAPRAAPASVSDLALEQADVEAPESADAVPAAPRLPETPDPLVRRIESPNRVAPVRPVVRPAEAALPKIPLTGASDVAADPEGDDRAAFEPLGLRLGGLQVFTTVATGVGTTFGTTDETFLRSTGEVAVRTDWERHGADLTLRGGGKYAPDGSIVWTPEADVLLDTRLDLTEVDRLGLSGGWTLRREDSASAEVGSGTGRGINTFSAELGYERSAGLIGLDAKAAVDRTIYDAGGDRTNTALSGTLRLTLDSGAVVEPFVETSVFTRHYDAEVDASGFRRSSLGGEFKGGILVDTGMLTGEISAGYALERPDDDRLSDVEGIIADAALTWRLSPLASIALRGTTTFEPTQIAGAAGSVVRTLAADGSYSIRPNLLLTAGATYSLQDYAGISRTVETTTLRAGAAWKLNRAVEFGVAASHEFRNSSVAGEDENDTTLEATITLRR